MWTARWLYELWSELDDPSWFALSNAERVRWQRIARELDASLLAGCEVVMVLKNAHDD